MKKKKKKGIVIKGRVRITSDKHNYIVERRVTVKDKETGEKRYRWGRASYFKDIEGALNDVVDEDLLKPNGRMQVEEFIERVKKVRRLIKKIGKRCISLWGIE